MKVLSEKAISLTTDGGTDKNGYRSSQQSFFIQEGRPTTDISETESCLPIQPTLQRSREDLQQRQSTSSAVLQERTWCEKQSKEKLSVSKGSLELSNTKDNFIAGKTALHFIEWVKITNDKWILHTICGYSVELCESPKQKHVPSQLKFSDIEIMQIEEELDRFLECKIIEKVNKQTKANLYQISLLALRKREKSGSF